MIPQIPPFSKCRSSSNTTFQQGECLTALRLRDTDAVQYPDQVARRLLDLLLKSLSSLLMYSTIFAIVRYKWAGN